MKRIFIAALLCGLIVSCNKKADDPAPAPTEVIGDTVIAPDSHISRGALDYLGIYKGTLPCYDCSGIETTIQLSEDFSYVMTRKHIGKSEKPIEQKGTYRWNKDGKSIVISAAGADQAQFAVGENTLTQLDQDADTEATSAPGFVLTKLSESQAVKTDATPEDIKPIEITGIHWKLTELSGKPVGKVNEKSDLFIEFKPNQDFSVFAGCNHIGGHFEKNGSKIKFLRVIGTQMACPDMSVEDRLMRALHNADNFVANEKVFQIRQGSTTLAKFDATKKPAK